MANMIVNFLGNEYISNNRLFLHVVQVGTGATGGQLVQMIAQMLSTMSVSGKFVIADADIVETKNLQNQLFIQKDVGKPKAEVLAQRYRAAYQVNIASYTEKYVEDLETLDNLFNADYCSARGYGATYLPILISCVDNKFSRKLFNDYFEKTKGTFIYIDVGNEGVILPEEADKPRKDWTAEEIETYKKSGYTGQVVAGIKHNGRVITEPLASIFPGVLDVTENDVAPSTISCGEVIASEPQRLITNRYAALCTATYLNELFSEGTLSNHITFFHASRMYMRSEPIKAPTTSTKLESVG